jgi:Tol biopolymer transport system component
MAGALPSGAIVLGTRSSGSWYLQDRRANWWYVALGGSSAEELISPRPSVTGMFPCAFSPDGQRLVFARLEGQYNQLFLLDMAWRIPSAGGEEELFLEEPMRSPDGRYLVYGRGRGNSSLWMLTISPDDSPP